MTNPPLDPRPLRLTKHHGAGNDFLVLVDSDDDRPLDPALVRALCDRRFGVGADGVVRVRPGRPGADLAMELRNADGRVAEMSGNGMRCLAQAAVDAGLVRPPTFSVATAAGVRTVEYRRSELAGAAEASVGLGPARLGPDQPQQSPGRRARTVDMGNPHLVLLGPDPAAVAVSELGPRLEESHPGGVNVEFIGSGPGSDELTLRVWERGVGETEACGTGSGAAAAAAHSWGLVGREVAVHNPGGTLHVTLGDDEVRLRGPVHRVAELVVDPGAVLAARRPERPS